MTDHSKNGFAFWGFALVSILALGFCYHVFGDIWGNLVLVPIVLVGWHMTNCWDELEYFRREEEERLKREQEAYRSKLNE